MRYRCISVLEEYICTQDYTPFGGPAWGLPVKMLNIFTPTARGLRPLGSGSRGPLWTPLARTLEAGYARRGAQALPLTHSLFNLFCQRLPLLLHSGRRRELCRAKRARVYAGMRAGYYSFG